MPAASVVIPAGALRFARAPRPGLLPATRQKAQISAGLSFCLDEKRGSRQVQPHAEGALPAGGSASFAFRGRLAFRLAPDNCRALRAFDGGRLGRVTHQAIRVTTSSSVALDPPMHGADRDAHLAATAGSR